MMMAAAAKFDDRGAFEQDCRRCVTDDKLRERWGCDGPTACDTAQFEHDCPVCMARPVPCDYCDSTGVVVVRRCPWQLFDQTHVDVVMAGLRVEQGILPVAGGWHDQTSTFAYVYDTVHGLIQEWRALLMERQQRKG